MNPFPVSSSILSTPALVLLLQEKYGLGSGTTCKLLKAGISHSYLVADGEQRYIFRIYSLDWRSDQEIAEEIRLITLLKDHGIPVSYAIPDARQQYIQELNAPEGRRQAVLFSYARGEKVIQYPAEIHELIGATMARIHQVTHQQTLKRVTYTPATLLDPALERLATFLDPLSEEIAFLQKLAAYIKDTCSQANTVAVRQGVVHLDIWFDNMHIYAGEEVTIFDFDFCGNGWLASDIAYYTMQLYNVEKEESVYQEKLKGFLKGYESVTAISAEEKRLLPVLGLSLYIFYLGIQCQRYDNWSNVFLNESYLKRFTNLIIRKWYDYNQLP